MPNNMRLTASSFSKLLVIVCFTTLSACSVLTPKTGDFQSQRQLNQVQHWQAKGKLAVASPQENASGYLTWQQNQQNYDVLVAGPFGAKASRLSGDNKHANLLLAGWKQAQQARSAEELMQHYLGWDFPVSSLHYWIKGQVAPKGRAKSHFDEHGLLQSLQQHGWQINFSRYQIYQGVWLPGLIKMQGYDHRFTFAISQWNIYDN